MSFENPKLKDVNYVCELIGCKPITVYRLARAKAIPHRRIGSLLRFSDQDIEFFLESTKKPAKLKKAEDSNEN